MKQKISLFLFTTHTCPNCETVKIFLNEKKIEFKEVIANNDNIEKYNLKNKIFTVPFLLYLDNENKPHYYDNLSSIKNFILNFKE